MLPLCLIVAAEAADPAALNREFDRLGFKPYAVGNVASALGLVDQWQFDAVLVDIDEPREAPAPHARHGSLLQVLPELRERCQAPIVVLSADAGEERQIRALQGGATDVIVKPASTELIAAKLHRLVDIARGAPATAADDERRHTVRLGPLRLDPRRAAAAIDDTALQLTAGEFELLLLLASRPGEFVHRDTIARTLGAATGAAGEGRRSADMHVCRIRKKLREAGAAQLRLETVYGRGYCLRLDRDAASAAGVRHPQWCA